MRELCTYRPGARGPNPHCKPDAARYPQFFYGRSARCDDPRVDDYGNVLSWQTPDLDAAEPTTPLDAEACRDA